MHDTLSTGRGVGLETKIVLNLGVYLRQTAKLEATDLASRAKAAGISRSTQHRWMTGRTIPDRAKCRAVARRLGVGVDELFPEVAA